MTRCNVQHKHAQIAVKDRHLIQEINKASDRGEVKTVSITGNKEDPLKRLLEWVWPTYPLGPNKGRFVEPQDLPDIALGVNIALPYCLCLMVPEMGVDDIKSCLVQHAKSRKSKGRYWFFTCHKWRPGATDEEALDDQDCGYFVNLDLVWRIKTGLQEPMIKTEPFSPEVGRMASSVASTPVLNRTLTDGDEEDDTLRPESEDDLGLGASTPTNSHQYYVKLPKGCKSLEQALLQPSFEKLPPRKLQPASETASGRSSPTKALVTPTPSQKGGTRPSSTPIYPLQGSEPFSPPEYTVATPTAHYPHFWFNEASPLVISPIQSFVGSVTVPNPTPTSSPKKRSHALASSPTSPPQLHPNFRFRVGSASSNNPPPFVARSSETMSTGRLKGTDHGASAHHATFPTTTTKKTPGTARAGQVQSNTPQWSDVFFGKLDMHTSADTSDSPGIPHYHAIGTQDSKLDRTTWELIDLLDSPMGVEGPSFGQVLKTCECQVTVTQRYYEEHRRSVYCTQNTSS
ncbi:hypothetical protein FRC00_003542 [Tulasnella sp. 408]|nr:hypothetical protein FRC00_003542 [Tulasnella sp. 408]